MGKQRWDKDRHGDRGGWGGGTELLVGQEEKGCEEGEGSRRKTGLVVDTNRVVLWPLVQVKLGKVERGVEVATSRISLVEGADALVEIGGEVLVHEGLVLGDVLI